MADCRDWLVLRLDLKNNVLLTRLPRIKQQNGENRLPDNGHQRVKIKLSLYIRAGPLKGEFL